MYPLVEIILDGREYLIPTDLVSMNDYDNIPYVPGKISHINGEFHRTDEIHLDEDGNPFRIIVSRVKKSHPMKLRNDNKKTQRKPRIIYYDREENLNSKETCSNISKSLLVISVITCCIFATL